jgi:dTDP-4-dehydrorhamnose reductase
MSGTEFLGPRDERRLLVIGATGLVGSHFMLIESIGCPVIGLARHRPMWMQNQPFIEVDAFSNKIDWNKILSFQDSILFLSFPTVVDEVEKLEKSSREKILLGFSHFLKSAEDKNASVAFVSSDAVMWGLPIQKRFPGCAPSPINVYGELKAKCEEKVLASHMEGSLIIRCTPIGRHPIERAHGFLGGMIQRASTQAVQGYTDSYITPISTTHFKNTLVNWHKSRPGIASGKPEIVHFGTTKAISKFDILSHIFQKLGIKNQLEAAFLDPTKFLAKRVNDQSFEITSSGVFQGVSLEELLIDLVN